MEINLRYRTQHLQLTIGHDTITARTSGTVPVALPGSGSHDLFAGETHLERRADIWERRFR